jgi:hypothetical protein
LTGRAGWSHWLAQDVRDPVNEETVVTERNPHSGSAFQAIRAIDYTVIFVRDMAAMRRFYQDILGFPLLRELSPGWIEYRVGANTLALARPSRTAADVPTPNGSAALQLAFRHPKTISAPTTWCGRVSICSHRPPTRPLDIARCSSAIRTEICWKCLPTFSCREVA